MEETKITQAMIDAAAGILRDYSIIAEDPLEQIVKELLNAVFAVDETIGKRADLCAFV